MLLHLDIVTAAFVFKTVHGNVGVKVHTFKVGIVLNAVIRNYSISNLNMHGIFVALVSIK